MAAQDLQPVSIFCAYAPKDEPLYHELAAHLRPSMSRRSWMLKHASDVPPGDMQEQALLSLIEQADVVLVLLSSDFFLSVFSVNAKLQHVLEYKVQQRRLLPVLLRPCAWQDSPFGALQTLPRDDSSISQQHPRDAAWHSLLKEITLTIDHLPARVSVDKTGMHLNEQSANHQWFVPYQRNPFFTGRDELITTLRGRLQTGGLSGPASVLALSGLGGMGKTQIILEYAYRYRLDYDAILWVGAETPETLLADCTRLAEHLALSMKKEQGPSEPLAFVKEWLDKHRHWLLIFDNVDAIELISDFVPVALRSNGQIVLSTQAATVGVLAEVLSVEYMREIEGEELLLRRAGLLLPEASLKQANEQIRSAAAEILAELGGLPLAIDQAGAYIAETGCSLERYLRLFRQCQTRLLAQRGLQPPGHPESVVTTWKLSFQKIEHTPAADILRLCAFLAPDSIPEILFLQGEAVLGPRLTQLARDPLALDELLAVLRRYSLVKRNAERDTISLHRLIQAVLRETLKSPQQRMWARRAIDAIGKTIPHLEVTHWQAWQLYMPQMFACIKLVDTYQLVSPEAGWLFHQAGTMLRYAARYLEAEKMYQRALKIYEQVYGREHPDTATTLDALATLYGVARKYEQAVPLYEQALSIRKRLLGPEHPDTASTFNGLALLYSNSRQYDLSQPLYEQALSIREHMLGPEHPDTATTLDNLAMMYRLQNKHEVAEPLFKRALHIREYALGPEHPMTASTLNNLAVLYRMQGNYQLARPLFEQVLQIRKKTLGEEHLATATALSNLAYVARLQGQYEQSLHLYERALHIREQVFSPEHPNATITWLNIGELYLEMEAYEQAEIAISRALLTHEQALGQRHSKVADILKVYIRLLYAVGREEEAKQCEDRVQAISKR